MKPKTTFEDLGFNYLHQEQILKLEQITFSLSQNNPLLVKTFRQNFKILDNAFSILKKHVKTHNLSLYKGHDIRGEYFETSYEIFAELNATYPIEMSTIHSLGCLDFSEHHVKMYQLLMPFSGKAGMLLNAESFILN